MLESGEVGPPVRHMRRLRDHSGRPSSRRGSSQMQGQKKEKANSVMPLYSRGMKQGTEVHIEIWNKAAPRFMLCQMHSGYLVKTSISFGRSSREGLVCKTTARYRSVCQMPYFFPFTYSKGSGNFPREVGTSTYLCLSISDFLGLKRLFLTAVQALECIMPPFRWKQQSRVRFVLFF